MIIVPIKEGENIERALKRYKRKYNDTSEVKDKQRLSKKNILIKQI